MKTITFQQFWDAYGLKRDRFAAERVWQRMNTSDRRAAYNGIAAYRADCEQRGIHMMYGQGYLSHRRWEDELDAAPSPTPPKPKSAPTAEQLAKQIDMETW